MTNVQNISMYGLHVEIASDQSYFTVYNNEERPVGTINRPRVYSKEKDWKVYFTDGTFAARGIGPRTAMSAFCKVYVQDEQDF